jgi:hypothetical protein
MKLTANRKSLTLCLQLTSKDQIFVSDLKVEKDKTEKDPGGKNERNERNIPLLIIYILQ